MNILVLNAGSSSQKSSLYSFPDSALSQGPPTEPLVPLWEGFIDFGRLGPPAMRVETASGQSLKDVLPSDNRAVVVSHLLETLWQGPTQVISNKKDIHAVGHRVVHGGQSYQTAVLIDDVVKSAIHDLIPNAPAHNPVNLLGIELAQSLLGADIPQYAVFDTAFHSQMPEAAAVYPVPQSWIAQGIRRYGFHGTSHQYCAHRAAHLLKKPLNDLRLVIAHLGGGCSLCAVRNGCSIDTTMGFTPLDGLMMGTRSGSIDPGILTYLMREHGYTHEQLDQQLNKASGLKGVSGLSSDMREIVSAMHEGHAQAKLAFDIYIHRLRSGIAAMTASLGGIDALIFTAGVGEHATIVRAEVCEGLSFLGLGISEVKNMSGTRDRNISSDQAVTPSLVIHTQEDWQIAKTCWQLQRT